MEETLRLDLKIGFFGCERVGKSALVKTLSGRRAGLDFDTYKATKAADFVKKQLELHGVECNLLLWDQAGAKSFTHLG